MYGIGFYEYAYDEYLVDAETGKVYGLKVLEKNNSLMDWALSDVQVADRKNPQVEIEICNRRTYFAWLVTHDYINAMADWLENEFGKAMDVEDDDEAYVAEIVANRYYNCDEIAAEDVRKAYVAEIIANRHYDFDEISAEDVRVIKDDE